MKQINYETLKEIRREGDSIILQYKTKQDAIKDYDRNFDKAIQDAVKGIEG
jgi:hypothetical protein